MTPEQEQLIVKMLARLADTKLVTVGYYGATLFECLFCDGESVGLREFFKHATDCPIVLAQQLRAMDNRQVEADHGNGD